MAGRRSKNDRGAPVKKMISNKKLRSSLSRVPIYTILLACLTSLFINWFVVLETSDRIEKKVTEDAYRELQQTSALFADQISNSINSVDATLRMAGHLMSEDSAHLDKLIERKIITLEPLVLLTFVDKEGRAVETNMGMDPDRTNLADRESVRVHLDGQAEGLFIGKPLIGRFSQSWVFHLSRKVLNTDGSLRGVLVASVNPYYFACFWDELLKGDHMTGLDPTVSLYGFDGVIRTGSRHLESYLANLQPQTWVLKAANTGLNGRFEYQSTTGPRASAFVKMMDKPLIAVASYSSAGIAARTAQQQVESYTIGVIISAIIVLTGAIMLIAMNTCRRNEKRASAAEVRLASALNTIKDSFAIYDPSGQLTSFNKAFSESFSKQALAADLPTIIEYLHSKRQSAQASEDISGADAPKRDALAYGPMIGPERENEINVGGDRWLRVESSKTPLGETVVYGTDVSESRLREAALVERTRQVWAQARKMKDLAEMAERATKVKSSFLAAMSHEIRTPLNAINGFAQILGKSAIGEEPQHISKLINQSCRHLLDIVDDILDFTRLEADRVTLHSSRISLQRLMEELVETASILTQGKPVRTSFSMEPETPAFVVADMRRLKQVLLNLLSNAAKFTQSGEIKLTTFMKGEMICFQVADSGDGIAPVVGQSIFEPFEQGSFAGRIRSSGTGLGLAITKRLINLMGGSISYTSELGVGTTFHVEMPYVESVSPQLEAPSLKGVETPLPSLRILIAEDAPSSRMLLRMILTKQGHMVDDVDNGQKALEALLKTEYDIAILDVQMPVMDGLEAAEALRASHGPMTDVPLIALTAQVLDEEVERIRASGFDRVLGKPFMEDDLVAAIRALVRAPVQVAPAPVAAGLHSMVAPELVHNKDA